MMEHLWSRADADSGNPQKVQRPRKPLRHLRTAAVSCIPLRPIRDGKGRVDATSPLLKRGSPSSLRKEIESREPEG